jgi:hypothetical protein
MTSIEGGKGGGYGSRFTTKKTVSQYSRALKKQFHRDSNKNNIIIIALRLCLMHGTALSSLICLAVKTTYKFE